MRVDPQLADINTAWWLEDATGAYLYRWSHSAKLVPEVASRVVVSDGGLAYTFTLRRVFRFSDCTPVSARSFAYALSSSSPTASTCAASPTNLRSGT